MPVDHSRQLLASFAQESTAEALAGLADTSLDAAIESGALNGIPVIGLVTGGLKAARDIRAEFLVRKLGRFLSAATELTRDERADFYLGFSSEAQRDEFGASLLVLIERAEDLDKPRILGRLLVACARGAFSRADLLRMSKMVDRSYTEDLLTLREFYTGLQAGKEIASHCLAAAGWIYEIGFDGGEIHADGSQSGGTMYEITDHGQWLAKFGLSD